MTVALSCCSTQRDTVTLHTMPTINKTAHLETSSVATGNHLSVTRQLYVLQYCRDGRQHNLSYDGDEGQELDITNADTAADIL